MSVSKIRESKVKCLKTATEIRKSALSGAYSVKQLAKMYNVSPVTIYRVLKQQRWQTGEKPINLREIRMQRMHASIHAIVKLGIKYEIVARFFQVSISRISQIMKEPSRGTGDLPIRIYSKKLDLRDDEGQIIHNGLFFLKGIGGDAVLLQPKNRGRVHFTNFDNLLGRVKIPKLDEMFND